MAILSRDQILSADDSLTKEVDAHEWGAAGDTVLVRALNFDERNDWRRGMLIAKPKTDPKSRGITWDYVFDAHSAELSTIRMLTLACIDKDGKKIFTAADIDRLKNKSAIPIERIVIVIKEISGLADDSEETAEKNSEPSPSESSSSV